MKYKLLYAKMIEKGYNQKSFADVMGMTERTLNSKLNGTSDWKLAEMIKASQLLGLGNQYNKYFFNV